MYDTVIFDLDGTLLYTLEDLADSVNHVLLEYGYPVHTYEEIRSYIGSGAKRLIEMSLPEGTCEQTITEAFQSFKKYYTAHSQVKTRPYPGIMDMLGNLKKRGVRMAIVSNKNAEAVRELQKHYFEGLIELAVGEGGSIKRKPDPSSILHVIEKFKSEKALYVGDSLNDRLASENAGIDCCLVTWGFGYDIESLNPEYLADTSQELERIILG